MSETRSEPTIAAHTIVVPRSARYYSLGPTHGFPRELWFVCHGYGQLARRFIRHFAPLDDGTRLVVAPEALSRFYLDPVVERMGQASPRIGATWMTREDREAEIADYVAYLDRVAEEVRHSIAGAAPRIVVLGFSQGASTVCRWLAASELRADQLVLWAGQVPPELDVAAWMERLQGARLTILFGDRDELASSDQIAREAERLSAAGVAFELQRFEGAHVIEPNALVSLAEGFAGR